MVCNDPRVAELIKTHFIPIANDDVAYKFSSEKSKRAYKVMASILGQNTEGETQGIYAATSSGRLLFFHRHDVVEDVIRGLEDAIDEYRSMSREERILGGAPVTARDGIAMPRRPSHEFVDLRVTKRSMPNDRLPEFDARHEMFFHFDYLWLKPEEVAAFVPKTPTVGAKVELPASIVHRFVWNNLLVLEHRNWLPEHIEQARLSSTVEEIVQDEVKLTLEGRFLMRATNFEYNDGKYDGRLLGHAVISTSTGKLKSFEAVALGADNTTVGREPDDGPPKNVVGAVFDFNDDHPNAKAFPSNFPTGYESW